MQQPPDLNLAFLQDSLSLLVGQDHTMARKGLSATGRPSAARQTRRRTSPKDQAILEVAYKQDPKPDKAARAEIARQVSLGEKEISIFPKLNSSQGSAVSSDGHHDATSQEQPSSQTSTTFTNSQLLPGSEVDDLPSKASNTSLSVSRIEDQTAIIPKYKGESQQSRSTQTTSDVTEIKSSQSLATSAPIQIDPLSLKLKTAKSPKKQQNTPFALYDELQAAESENKPVLSASLKRTVSQPRLSTSLSGSVRIKTGVSPSPSPPRLQNLDNNRQPRFSGPLQRSQSAIVTSTIPTLRATASFGRSKDSRSWEFCCDADVRDELTKQAEREQKGSAAGAIGLIRSRSKGSLSTGAAIGNTNKRTANSTKSEAPKRVKADLPSKSSKPKLGRASSSVARMQGSNASSDISKIKKNMQLWTKTTTTPTVIEDKPPKKKFFIDICDAEGNESDKENWAPGTQVSVTPRRRRPNATTTRTKILRENTFLSSQSTSLSPRNENRGTRTPRYRGVTSGKENKSPDIDEDEEDLAGVQGLLSLSQGAWR
ncbi:MAG: hypothetical protein Q9225_004739 [Loekoesia sp. 1 TL-2023]